MHALATTSSARLMAQAASQQRGGLGSSASKAHWTPCGTSAWSWPLARTHRQQTELRPILLAVLAYDLLPNRPHRVEPRHQKRRRKAYRNMTKPARGAQGEIVARENLQKTRGLTTCHSVANQCSRQKNEAPTAVFRLNCSGTSSARPNRRNNGPRVILLILHCATVGKD